MPINQPGQISINKRARQHPFPGTALHHQLKAQGRLLREVYWESCTLFDVTFQPLRLSVEALRQGFEELMVSLYSPEAMARRRARWRDCLRQGRERGGAGGST